MKVSYHHLSKFFIDDIDIGQISEKLFQLGHEHEIDNDIFDIEFTPNRGDCLSLLGLSRDLNLFYETKKDLEIYTKDINELDLDFNNLVKDTCPSISFMLIEVVKTSYNYKDYLENYFTTFKSNKNNLFTDISNYLSYEIGQPTHCYDFEKISGPITLQELSSKVDFKTVTGDEITLKDNDTVFTIEDSVINLAGVMGGIETACSKNTTKVLIECAYFSPDKIIGKSIEYDLNSEAAYKFERGVDPCKQEFALRRFAKIIEDHADIKDIKFISHSFQDHKYKYIDIDIKLVGMILGFETDISDYIRTFEKLGFKIVDNQLQVPSFRSDITTQNDIAEELARAIGYDSIERNSFEIASTPNLNKNNLLTKLKSFLIDNGFHEVINSTFVIKDSNKSIKVDNPLDVNKKYIRTNLKNSLINNLAYNENRQKDSIKLFEISDVYSKNDGIKKILKIGIIASGRLGHNYIDFSKKIDENYIENIVTEISPQCINKIEQINRNEIESKSKSKIFFVEIEFSVIKDDLYNLASIDNYPKNFNQYKKISEFPCITRDISFAIMNKSSCIALEKELLKFNSKDLKKSYIFDYFENKNDTRIIKMGFRFVFQSQFKTLTDKEVDKEINNIIKLSSKIDGVQVPGL